MVYIGTRLPTSGRHAQVDPCLINPELEIDKVKPDHEGSHMGYWPSYSQIPPACRAAYLEWLANGRRNPNTCIGYVFLFFYGLERRVLRDYQTLKIDISEEFTQISTEVEQLLEIYGNKGSFGSYGSRFLEVCRVLQNSKNVAEAEPPLTRTGWGIPLNLRVSLGQMVAEGQPIPADWMFSWYLHSEQARLRTPATRCADEFRQLFRLRYRQHYGEGMLVKPNKRKLKIEYHPASSGFFGVDVSELNVNVGDLPDITALSAPLNKLQTLIDDCTDALDPYSRWLGRNGESPDSKAALALLPPELIEGLEDDHVCQLKQWLVQTIGEQDLVVMPGKQLLSRWDTTSAPLQLTKKESTTLAQGLEKLGFGIEPDVRFGGKPFKGNSHIALFRLPDIFQATPSKEYTAATLLLHLAASMASSDAVIDATEQQHLERHLESALHLSSADRLRLKAHLAWLLEQELSLRGLKTKLSKMTSDEKAGIADFLIGVAGADGYISPQEISILTKIYPLLGFETDEIYSRIHTFSISKSMQPATDPVTVRSASPISNGFAIPAPPETQDTEVKNEGLSQNQSGFELDLAVIQLKQKESAKVAEILGDLFEDGNSDTTFLETKPSTGPKALAMGLNFPNSQFLLELIKQTEWSRLELENKADEMGIMLDGALEVINDAVINLYDEPLIIEDGLIEVSSEIASRILSEIHF